MRDVSQQGKWEYWKKVIVMLCLGWTVIWIYRTILNPILPEIQQDLNVTSDASMGLIFSVFFFAYTMMQIPSGLLADRFGRKTIIIPGFILFTLGAVLVGFSTSLMFILVASFITGLGQGTYYGPAYSISSETIPKEKRGISTAIINSGSAIGMAIGLIGSSFLVKDAGWNWRVLLFITAGLAFSLMLVFAKNIKKNTPQSKAAGGTSDAENQDKATFKRLLANPKMVASYVLYFATCYGYYMIVTWLPSYLQDERGFTGTAIGFAAALVAFSAVPGALLFSRLSDKFMHKKITFIIILELLAAVMLYLTVSVQTTTLLIVCLILYGFLGKLAVEPILISYVADIAPKQGVGSTFGIFNFFGMMSSVVAPFVTGLISDATGSKVLGFYLATIIILVGAAVMLLANMKKTPQTS
ncbi:MFS transporter [Paenibacillus thiaminolyticus]|uniref:MFS transporter n=1 Tax=Paenibacillus thiaminolyticus TaxID=49283 RepID=UPI00232F1351|nr:MFS transporter [Paenibacillus thiaminolyticus]WCF09552.1 MFS transporter [Paenibacillus thiaminolyticus]WII38761.1 MFS transporter [Paenibacillus thiaminolyticus]